MYKCAKCNKEFIFESEYNRHKNRKTPCNQPKEDLECKLNNGFNPEIINLQV